MIRNDRGAASGPESSKPGPPYNSRSEGIWRNLEELPTGNEGSGTAGVNELGPDQPEVGWPQLHTAARCSLNLTLNWV